MEKKNSSNIFKRFAGWLFGKKKPQVKDKAMVLPKKKERENKGATVGRPVGEYLDRGVSPQTYGEYLQRNHPAKHRDRKKKKNMNHVSRKVRARHKRLRKVA